MTAAVVQHHLSALLVGQDPADIALRTEEMRLAVHPYAAGAVGSMAVSACELALWDLVARAVGVPLVWLLGGTARTIPHYVTCPAVEPAIMDAELLVTAQVVKLAMPFGPVDGRDGMRANLELLAEARQLVPEHVGPAVDCFMSWDLPYAVEFVDRSAGLDVRWIEEPFPLDWRGDYVRLRERVTPVRVAGGEYLYGLDAATHINEGCVDILQVDVTWCGGLHTARTLATLAAERGVLFAPHLAGLQPWTIHLLAACPTGQLAEVPLGVSTPNADMRPGSTPGVGLTPQSLGFDSGTDDMTNL